MWKRAAAVAMLLIGLTGCNSEDMDPDKLPVASHIQSLDFDYPINDDLQPILEHIGERRYIGLSELSHGGAKGFTYRTRLIKYLYEEADMDVVAMESGLYDGLRLWQRLQKREITDLREAMLYSFMFMYAETPEIYPLYRYMEQQAFTNKPLMLIAFDGRHHSYPSCYIMIYEMEEFTEQNFNLSIDWARFQSIAKQTMCPWTFGDVNTDADIEFYRETLDTLTVAFNGMKQIQDLPPLAERADFQEYATVWHQVVKGMKAYTYSRFDGDYAPDEVMQADNLIWLANEWLPGKRIMAWGHTSHLGKYESSPTQDGMKSAFQHLEDRQPGEVYSLIHTAYTAEFLAMEGDPELRKQTYSWAAPSYSLEYYLANFGVENAFIRASDIAPSGFGTSVYFSPIHMAEDIGDGYFFTREEIPSSIDSPR